jgi:hypothetical protein
MKRFIISGNIPHTAEATQRLVTRLKTINPDIAWWHYFGGLWLVVDSADKLNANRMRDELRTLFPGIQFMVFEIEPGGTWAGWGPTKSKQWLDEQWPV